MRTKFQRNLTEDKDTLLKIVKIFHPDIPDSITTKQGITIPLQVIITPDEKYDWVIIYGKVQGYGTVSIGISNSNHYSLFGPKITKEDITEALIDGSIHFRLWRFVDDLLSDTTNGTMEEEAIDLLKQKGYTLQSVEEFYKIYYKD